MSDNGAKLPEMPAGAMTKAEKFAKEPDMFVDMRELVMAGRFNDKGQIEIMLGEFNIDQYLHVRARMDDKVQDVVNFLKMKIAQEQAAQHKIIPARHGITDFMRRKRT